MKKIVSILIAVLVVLSLVPAMAEGCGAKVFTSSMDVYLKPNASEKPVTSLHQGTAFNVTAVSGKLARIEYKGHVGYAQLKNIIFDKGVKAIIKNDTKMIFITKDSAKAGKSYTANIPANTKVYVVGMNDQYLLIKNLDGTALGIVKAADVQKVA